MARHIPVVLVEREGILGLAGPLSDFPGGSDGKASAYNVGDPGSIPGLGRSSGEGNGNPFQYSCLENPWTEEHCRLQSMGPLSLSKKSQDFSR